MDHIGFNSSLKDQRFFTTRLFRVICSEVVLPIEVELQSLRVLVEIKVLEEDWMKQRYEQLALVDEKRARAQYHAQGYQNRIARAFNKKVKP